MGILTGPETRVIVQGITGRVGAGFARRLAGFGTRVVGGVTPGKGGAEVDGLPVFDSCHDAVARTGADTSFVVVPPAAALDAVYEAVDAGIRLMVLYIENIPVLDALRFTRHARARGAVVLGPNSAGCITAGGVALSEVDPRFLLAGRIGVVCKSGAMCAESAMYLKESGLGVSTIVSIGGDHVLGTYHADVLRLFEADPDTDAVVLIGEIGGRSELEAARAVAEMTKPVIATIIGGSAPEGRQMGHPGARTGEAEEGAAHKRRVLAQAGAVLTADVTEVGRAMRRALESRVSKRRNLP
ncbi:MAG: CoA-binding protein [Alphaproteobacteria bacterium]